MIDLTDDERAALFKMTPEDRRRMSAVAAAHSIELRELIAERIAFRMVQNTDSYRRRHFFVLDDRKPVPFERHWNFKNVSGVTFTRAEAEAARAWVKAALLAGFTVFYSNTKRGWGAGRGLANGVYGEDELWLYRELRARAIESLASALGADR